MDWPGDLLEKMPRPDNLSGFWWHVSDSWGILFCVLVELLLNAFEVSSVDVEDVVVLVLELVPERVSLEDILEFGQQLQRVLDVSEFGEVLINEVLELCVQSGDLHVELDVVFVELGLLELKEGVALGTEVGHLHFELVDQLINTFKVMLLKSLELLLGLEDLNQLEDSSLEDIELPEDLGL
jgi:hypothetical protein